MDEVSHLLKLYKQKRWELIKTYPLKFIRSQCELSVYKGSGGGWILSSYEVCLYYADYLEELSQNHIVRFNIEDCELPYSLLRLRRQSKLSIIDLAEKTGLTVEDIMKAESPDYISPIDNLRLIAVALNANPYHIGIKKLVKIEEPMEAEEIYNIIRKQLNTAVINNNSQIIDDINKNWPIQQEGNKNV